jgi:FkbH-like protein
LILDCDNTLWGGVLNEDDFSDIKYNNKREVDFTFKNFQEKIKELKNKGFLLSLCSKNNENQVWSFFKKKKMVLQKKDFILSKINWNEKSSNINYILKNLNLRPEDCLFIDDNILEIDKVKRKIKNINTYHLKDISKIKKLFDYDNRLNKFIITKDDIRKYKQYKLKSKFTNYISNEKVVPSLLRRLNQKIKISNCKNLNLKRAEELFNKTNQFNFSLNRYKIHDLLNMLNRKDFELKLFSLKDKFGDHGIIGAYILKKSGDLVLINDFVLSCRVLYRYVEEFILCHIIKRNPKKKVEIMYKKTNVNSNLIPKFLEKQHFSLSYKDKGSFFYKVKFRKGYIDETEKIFK